MQSVTAMARSNPVAQVVAQRGIGHVDAVGDEHDRQPIVQAQCPLDDVVVAGERRGAAVAQVGEDRQPCVNGGAKLVEAGIAVAGRDQDAPGHKVFRHAQDPGRTLAPA